MIFQCMRHMSCENSLHIVTNVVLHVICFFFHHYKSRPFKLISTQQCEANGSSNRNIKCTQRKRERERRNTTMAYHTNVIFRSLSQPLWNLYIVCCLYLLGALFIPTIFGDDFLLSSLLISWSRCRSLRSFNPHNSLIMPERWQSMLSLIGYFCIYPLLLRDQPAFKLQPKH